MTKLLMAMTKSDDQVMTKSSEATVNRFRVRSRVFACHEGWASNLGHGAYAILWDNGSWSYLSRDEFIVIA